MTENTPDTRPVYNAACHCGTVRFTVKLTDGLRSARRSNPGQYGVNVACLEGMSPFDFDEVPVNEGGSHPKDRPGGSSLIAGWLRYQANPEVQGD